MPEQEALRTCTRTAPLSFKVPKSNFLCISSTWSLFELGVFFASSPAHALHKLLACDWFGKFWAERQNGDKKILRLLGCDPPIGAATAYAAKIQSDRVLPMGSENAVQDFGAQRRYICNGGSSVWYNPTQPSFDAPAVLTGSQPSRATLCTSGCAQGSSRNSKLHGISAPRQGSFSACNILSRPIWPRPPAGAVSDAARIIGVYICM